MKNINFSNVEEIIFFDRQAQNVLPPHYFSLFEQWRLAQRFTYLRELGKQAIIDFLQSITDEEIELLEGYFDEKVFIEKLSYNVAVSRDISLNQSAICETLCGVEGFPYYTMWRDEYMLHITFWR